MTSTRTTGQEYSLPDEVYDFRGDRTGNALTGGLVCASAGATGQLIGMAASAVLYIPAVGTDLRDPYEVRIPAGDIRLSRALGRSSIPAATVASIVRRVGQSDQSLSSIRLEHSEGSASLPGDESLSGSIRRRAPEALITTEGHDDNRS